MILKQAQKPEAAAFSLFSNRLALEAEDALRESELRFREIIDALPAAIYTTDPEGRLTHFNPAAVEFSGRVPELGTDQWCVSWQLYYPDGSPMPHDECPMAIALKEGRIIRGAEAIAERPDGKRIWFTPYPTPLRDADGRIVGGINMLLDITDRKQAERAISRLAAIVESSEDAIIVKDLNGVIQSWNDSATEVFGYTAKEAIGQPILMLIPPERQHEESQILRRIKAGERVEHFETVRVRKDGRLLDISLTISPIKDGQGRIIGASKIARDITERKRIEGELAQARQRLQKHSEELEKIVAQRTAALEATNEQLEAFVYSIAHDLRAPLRSMIAYSQLLVDDHSADLNESGKRMLQRIQASSEFMDRLLVDLLAYGRTARAEIEVSHVDVQKAWECALFQSAPLIEHVQAEITTIQPLPTVLAHEITLGQVLTNLLSNACKFVAEGIRPRIRFSAEDRGEMARLWIQDNGIGIPQDQQDRAFRVFERLNGGRFPGTGIGLSIVRKGVERMMGKVGLESEVGKGTRFWIELPKAG